MKKRMTVVLTMALLLTLFAGCGKNQENAGTVAPVPMPGSALEILESVWAQYGDDEKFPIIGGNMEANIMDAPGAVDMAYAGHLNYNLLVPENLTANVTEAASMIHMMNANTFTCGVFKINSISAADFGAAMKEAVLNNQWMCGFPETLLIRNFSDAYVLVAFGVNDAMTPFEKHLSETYPGMETITNEPIV